MHFSYLNANELGPWLGGHSATVVAIDPTLISTECGKCSMMSMLDANFPDHVDTIFFMTDDDSVVFKKSADIQTFQMLTKGLAVRDDSHFYGRPFRPAQRMKRVGYPGSALFDEADVLSNNDIKHRSAFRVSERGYEIFVFLESCGHKGVCYDYVEEVFIFKDDTDAGLFQAYIMTLPDVPKNKRGTYKRPKNMAELEAERQEQRRKELEAIRRAEEEYKRRQYDNRDYFDIVNRISRARRNKKDGGYEFALSEKQIEELLKYVEDHHKNRTTVSDWDDQYNHYSNYDAPHIYKHKK